MESKKQSVLLIEDTPSTQAVVQSLIGERCSLVFAGDLKTAERQMNDRQFSLVILDVELPDGNGFQFCEKLRTSEEYREVPIMFLTSKDDVEDRVRGFDMGADDYVTKPLEPKEFIARVEAKLRVQSRVRKAIIKRGVFRIDTTAQKGYIKDARGVEVDLSLTPIEYKLLAYFISNEGVIFAREDLKVSIWGPSVFVSDHTLDTHIYSTRKKIAPYGSALKAIVKKGYCFTLPTTPATISPA